MSLFPSSTQRITAWLSLILIFLVATLAWWFIEKNSEKSPALTTTGALIEGNQNPNEVHSYTGLVKLIEDNKITFEAKKNNNNLVQDEVLVALVTADTDIYKIEIPRIIPEQKTGSIFKKIESSLEEIKIGDTITVFNKNNIRDKGEFGAETIEKQVIK